MKPQVDALKKSRASTYRAAMNEVVDEARQIAQERRRALDEIIDEELRSRAAG
jgi:hypothetical protein